MVEALIDDSEVDADGALNVTTQAGAAGVQQIIAVAVGVAGALSAGNAGGVSIAGAGSGSGNTMDEDVTSSIENTKKSGKKVTTANGKGVKVTANDYSQIVSGSGSGAFGIGTYSGSAEVGVGVAISSNDISNSVLATINDSTVSSSGAVYLEATSSETIESVTTAGGISAGGRGVAASGVGARSHNTIDNAVKARISGSSMVTTAAAYAGDVTLTAQDTSTIIADGGGRTLAGTLGGGLDVAVGAAEAINKIGTSTTPQAIVAEIDDSTVTPAGRFSSRRFPTRRSRAWVGRGHRGDNLGFLGGRLGGFCL